jgi:uncharacterized protein YndB with AHSA1/START domain
MSMTGLNIIAPFGPEASSSTAAFAPADEVLVITRIFDAPRELVFKLWTDPDHAMKWWGPRDYPAKYLDMDVRPGGAWRSCLRSPESGEELWHGGVFREVVPPYRLEFTFAWDEDGERGFETVVTVGIRRNRWQDPDDLPSSSFPVGKGARWASRRLDEHIRPAERIPSRFVT